MAHLDGAGDQNFVVHASAFAACAAADPGFVHFDVFVRATPDAILVRRTIPARSLWRIWKLLIAR